MRVNITNLEKALEKSLTALNEIKSKTIYVGIRKNKELVENAFRQEFGCWNEAAQKMNPARPFLAKTFSGIGGRNIKKRAEEQISKLITQKGKEKADRVLKNIAKYAANEVKLTIGDQNFVPNSEETIRKKKGSLILVDTGEMLKSIEGWVE